MDFLQTSLKKIFFKNEEIEKILSEIFKLCRKENGEVEELRELFAKLPQKSIQNLINNSVDSSERFVYFL